MSFFGRLKRTVKGIFSRKKSEDDFEVEYHNESDPEDSHHEYVYDEVPEVTQVSESAGAQEGDTKEITVERGTLEDPTAPSTNIPEIELDARPETTQTEIHKEIDEEISEVPPIEEAPDLAPKKQEKQHVDKTTLPFIEIPEEIKSNPMEEESPDSPTPKLKSPLNLSGIKDKLKNTPGLLRDRLTNLRGLKGSSSIPNFGNIFDNAFKIIFNPESRRTIHLSFVLLLIVSSSYMVGKMLAHGLEDRSRQAHIPIAMPPIDDITLTYKKNTAAISSANLFNSGGVKQLFKPKSKITKKSPLCMDSSKKSSLPYKLMHTIVLQDSRKSIAAIRASGSNKIKYLREGERLKDITVGRISRLKVAFSNNKTQECEYIARKSLKDERIWNKRKPKILSGKQGTEIIQELKDDRITQIGNNFKIDVAVKDEALKRIDKILTEARAVQIKNPDGSLCFKMVDVIPGSIYSKLDIKNNDIICNINGNKIENLNSLISLFGKIKDIQDFEMVIKRDGQDINREYNFQ